MKTKDWQIDNVKKKFRFMDFCAGIGAGRLGCERAGMQCVGYSELSCIAVNSYKLIHNAHNEINYGDLTQIVIDKLPDFELMIAGFPCQSFSVLGQRKGFADQRGQIIYHLAKILQAKQAPYFVLENVKGLTSHDNGKTLQSILQILDQAGYFVDYKVLNSIDYGVPQMRERVYFVGIHKSNYNYPKYNWPRPIARPPLQDYLCDSNAEVLPSNDSTFVRYLNNKYNASKHNLQDILDRDYLVLDTRQSDLRLYVDKVPTLRAGRHGILYAKDKQLRKLSAYESLLSQGFDHKRASQAIGKVPNKNILEQAGNAMTVPVIEALVNSFARL